LVIFEFGPEDLFEDDAESVADFADDGWVYFFGEVVVDKVVF
jgi:hypothetical protein